MATTNTYLNFDGNCEEAFTFYKTVFGGDLSLRRFEEMPKSDDYEVADADMNKIMHANLPLGSSVLMGSDIAGDWAAPFVQGTNFSISIFPDNKAEADLIFNALSAGGQITTPLHNTFWGAYFGMLTDKFGISWMVNFLQQ